MIYNHLKNFIFSYSELIKLIFARNLIICWGMIGIGIQSIVIRVLLNYGLMKDRKILFINCDDWILKLFNKPIRYNSQIFNLEGENIYSGYRLINIIFSF